MNDTDLSKRVERLFDRAQAAEAEVARLRDVVAYAAKGRDVAIRDEKAALSRALAAESALAEMRARLEAITEEEVARVIAQVGAGVPNHMAPIDALVRIAVAVVALYRSRLAEPGEGKGGKA